MVKMSLTILCDYGLIIMLGRSFIITAGFGESLLGS